MSAKILSATPPGILLLNVAIPKAAGGGFHPHLVDFYIPYNNAFTRAMVMLHGGSGSKTNLALNLAIANALPISLANVNWAMLSLFQVMAVIPQGQACTGIVNAENPNGVSTISATHPTGVATWTNHVTWSQADDVQFLTDLRTYITSNYGSIGASLCGHSNGGGMVNRMWYEAPTKYTHYCACSGPASNYYVSNPALPGTVKPFFQQIGLLDNVLDVSDGPAGPGSHFFDATWQQAQAQRSVDDVAFPSPSFWIGEWAQTTTRAHAYDGSVTNQGDGVVTSIQIGTQTTWTYSGGNVVLQLLSAAGHNIVSHEQATGSRLFLDWINFIRNT